MARAAARRGPGAGTGAVARALGAALPGLRLMVGCDLSSRMLAQARLPPPFGPVVGDMLRLPFRGAGFDLVTANCVLSHVRDQQAALRSGPLEARLAVDLVGLVVTIAVASAAVPAGLGLGGLIRAC